MSTDTSSRTVNGAKWVALTIAIIGIALSVFMFIRTGNVERELARETLAGTGEELMRVVTDLGALARNQAVALKGLFESSVNVTPEEFDHFADVISGAPVSSLLIAVGTLAPDSGELTWPVLYETSSSVVFGAGFDLATREELSEAIDRSMLSEAPIAAGFIDMPGNAEAGDLALVSSITRPNGELLAGLVIVEIDEAVRRRVGLLLDGGATSLIRVASPGEAPVSMSTADRWVGSVTLGGQAVIFELTAVDLGDRFGSTSDWLALLGIVTSALLAVLAYNLMNRRSATRRIAKLEQTLAEKDQFLATVSHELRTPLTAVVGMLEVINDNLENLDSDQYAVLLGDARDGALELERLIEDYLTAARLSAGALTIKQEAVNLDTIFGRTIARLNLPQTLTVTVDPLGSCVGDSLRIRQIARNILRNAARYADHQIQVRNVGDDSFVEIEIRNDGEPVAQDLLEKLFEPFGGSPAPGRTEPIGLGLSVSRGLARRMGGDLRYSVDGQWTVFSVVLPIGEPRHDIPDSSKEPARAR